MFSGDKAWLHVNNYDNTLWLKIRAPTTTACPPISQPLEGGFFARCARSVNNIATGADLGLGKGGVLFLCGQTTPISKPHPLIINALYWNTDNVHIIVLSLKWILTSGGWRNCVQVLDHQGQASTSDQLYHYNQPYHVIHCNTYRLANSQTRSGHQYSVYIQYWLCLSVSIVITNLLQAQAGQFYIGIALGICNYKLSLTREKQWLSLPLHQQTTSTSAAAGVGGAECSVHYFEFAEQ